ncbi:phage tail termination protein [Aquabacterium sp. OR-4]|uniref:phage tail termination protein n=1 Tax=Aquabacterium sp. OR-4 TaxID=2978127 RepID=UPI0021B23408|nr:hypothetical protein [Aquabacterium sp. OR-4]MDT7834959.1 hypothetical protein [Aquabacterium sp. OR-4]
MSAAADALRLFIGALLPGWRIQYGRWVDDSARTSRFAVIKPAGGAPAQLVRRPQFIVSLIGAEADEVTTISDAADAIVEAMRANSGGLVYLQAAEPVFMATGDGRPVFDIAVSAITT